jgi:hypothetical protein
MTERYLAIQFDLPDDATGTDEVECDCCDAIHEAYEALPIERPLARLSAGDTIPVGECPSCQHGFLYLVDDDES